jgi:hypothetical protein
MMRALSVPACIWFILCVLTAFSVLQVGEHWWRGLTPLLVIAIAAVKAQLVIHHYMEARRARPLWRVLYLAWNVVAAATIIIGVLAARGQGT